MRRVMKYIKPETTVVKMEMPLLLAGTLIEKGIVNPGTEKGTKEEGSGNIPMAKHNPFDIEDFDDTGWKTNDDVAW